MATKSSMIIKKTQMKNMFRYIQASVVKEKLKYLNYDNEVLEGSCKQERSDSCKLVKDNAKVEKKDLMKYAGT